MSILKEEEERFSIFNDLLNGVYSDNEKFLSLLDVVSLSKKTDPHTIFTWSGGKTKMRDKLKNIFEEMHSHKVEKTGKGYDIFIDGFYGGGGSFFSIHEDLKFFGVKRIILNDINECLLSVHQCVYKQYNEMLMEYFDLLRDKFIKPYKSIFVGYDELLSIYKTIREEFYELQNNKDFGVKSSIRFIILTMFSFSGNTVINTKGDFVFGKESVYKGDVISNILTIPTRLKKFNKIYNNFDIEFRLGDVFELLDEYKNNPNVFINLDPPYVDEDRGGTIEQDTLIKGVGIQYGQSDFPHERLVNEYLNCINFIYNNNIHPFLLDYKEKFDLNSTIHDRPNSNSRVSKGTKRNVVREIILYGNKTI